MTGTDWRTMDPLTRTAAYDNSAAVPNSGQRLERWRELSGSVRARDDAALDVAYGPLPRNGLDIFSAKAPDAPLLVFIHGGYWQRNRKDDFACMASGPLAHGLSVALVGYTLAPDASLAEIAAEIRRAIDFLRARDEAAGTSRRMIVAGWSAGGHLAALASRWPGVNATLAISGIFDLEPLRGTEIDDKLRLTTAEIDRLSPIRQLPAPDETEVGPLVIAFGADELPELQRQSRDYQTACAEAGLDAVVLPVAAANHFSVLDGLIEPAGVLTRAVVDLAARLPPGEQRALA